MNPTQTKTPTANPPVPSSPGQGAVESTGKPAPGKVSGEAKSVLIVSTVLFTLFFAVWVMFAIIGLPMRKELGLTESEFAFLIALPVLTGSILRVPVGIITDKLGGRTVTIALLLLTAVPTYLVSKVQTYDGALILALFVGLSGTAFASGVAWVSAWYPAQYQGFALGVFGMGNVGASITKLLAPTLVTAVGTAGLLGGAVPGGWRFVPVVYALMLVLAAAIVPFVVPRKDKHPSRGRGFVEMSKPLLIMRVWRFGFYYVTVFGAYVGLALWLPHYYVDVYDFSLPAAGLMTAIFIFPASLLRPLGGYLSDRRGARQITAVSFAGIAAASFVLCTPLSVVPFTLLVFIVGVAMGIGKASVYTYIPQYFPKDVGAVGGLVGAVGGLGGFVLPLLFAWTTSQTDRPESAFYVLLGLAIASILFLSIAVARLHADAHHGEM
ncbi:MAG: NarK/NasA family nitrate transporter [Thermoleophilaceae bacterium]|nr:NarK/NasA family nitrate transporter [Thermoleophilaceae bacterium]